MGSPKVPYYVNFYKCLGTCTSRLYNHNLTPGFDRVLKKEGIRLLEEDDEEEIMSIRDQKKKGHVLLSLVAPNRRAN